MSINEHEEFKRQNQRVSANRATHVKEVRRFAFIRLLVTALAVLAAFGCIVLLEQIGWINDIFSIVLTITTSIIAIFKAGWYWHFIKGGNR